MQTDDILILVLEEFSVLEDDEFSKAKLLIKFKEALVPETPLIDRKSVV